jgi:hypothetical protein
MREREQVKSGQKEAKQEFFLSTWVAPLFFCTIHSFVKTS